MMRETKNDPTQRLSAAPSARKSFRLLGAATSPTPSLTAEGRRPRLPAEAIVVSSLASLKGTGR